MEEVIPAMLGVREVGSLHYCYVVPKISASQTHICANGGVACG